MKVKLIAIAALGKNREIGLNGKLPWSIQEEHEHFIKSIAGEYVLTSRKNLELHGGMIPGAFPLIITRDENYSNPNALIFRDIMAMIEHAENSDIDTIFVLGGAEIYKLALPFVSEFLLSEINYDGPADTYFPEYKDYSWIEISQTDHEKWKLHHLIKIPQPATRLYE